MKKAPTNFIMIIINNGTIKGTVKKAKSAEPMEK
jgi:hypothetical protein